MLLFTALEKLMYHNIVLNNQWVLTLVTTMQH